MVSELLPTSEFILSIKLWISKLIIIAGRPRLIDYILINMSKHLHCNIVVRLVFNINRYLLQALIY